MRDRQEEIHAKRFDMTERRRTYDIAPASYGKIKVGTKTLDDAVLNLGYYKKINRNFGDKRFILKALYEKDVVLLREISNYFYRTSGIYSRLCNYAAFLYRYDWYIVPEIKDEKSKEEKILTEFNELLDFLDNSHIKRLCGKIALDVIKNGVYYGYIVPSNEGIIVQDLPIRYCRSRFFQGMQPIVEFNMKYFDEQFRDVQYRMNVLKMFPKEFQEGYVKYKQGKLPPDRYGDMYGSWYCLDVNSTIKFNLFNDELPLFVNVIPSLIDLDAAQDLDRRKQMQQLLKIVIQKLPLDKNGDLIFDVDEARDIHNNAVEMLQHAIGVDVLTTFADVDVEDMADSNTTTKTDDLEKMERAVFNNAATSRNLFNTDGNLSLEKSILNDEANIRDLLFQFHILFDRITQLKSKNKKKYLFKFYMLETTQYNYKELAKLYKEQVQIGYSKMLPQIAMGHSQSSIIHTAHFEKEVLHLSEIMIPPMQSSTMNADGLQALSGKGTSQQSDQSKNQNNVGNTNNGSSGNKAAAGGSKQAGRPEKSDDQKSEKTIQNKESMN